MSSSKSFRLGFPKLVAELENAVETKVFKMIQNGDITPKEAAKQLLDHNSDLYIKILKDNDLIKNKKNLAFLDSMTGSFAKDELVEEGIEKYKEKGKIEKEQEEWRKKNANKK